MGFTLNSMSGFAPRFSPDGKWVLAHQEGDQHLTVLDANNGAIMHELPHAQGWGAFNEAFSGDSRLLATSRANQQVRLWEPVGGRLVALFENLESGLILLALNADGSKLAIGCSQLARIYDTQTRTLRCRARRE